jgi:hypothetical protein
MHRAAAIAIGLHRDQRPNKFIVDFATDALDGDEGAIEFVQHRVNHGLATSRAEKGFAQIAFDVSPRGHVTLSKLQ